MAYNKFKKLETLCTQFGINDINKAWLPKVFPVIKASNIISEDLEDASKTSLTTLKAKSEYIIAPILKELKRVNNHQFSTYSGFQFRVDVKNNLGGVCDFVLSAEINKPKITMPIICVMGAKNKEISESLAECGAKMYAMQIFNEQKKQPRKAIYGCVTNVRLWCFLKLENKNLLIDPNYIPLTFANPNEVLEVWQWILDKSLANE